MAADLLAMGEFVAWASWEECPARARASLRQAVRISLLCAWLGLKYESWIFEPACAHRSCYAHALDRMMAGFADTVRLGTLAAAADLDPMDPSPSHTALPATLGVFSALPLTGCEPDDAGLEDRVLEAIMAGTEAAFRLRGAISGIRPGAALHTPGVFGTFATAAAAARLLRLSPEGCANAMGIALTRAAGLGVNNAATAIGLTHFGWGAGHGLEAALLAAQDWAASHDLEKALSSLYGGASLDTAALSDGLSSFASSAHGLVFKHYPCNIYLNAVVKLLDTPETSRADKVTLHLPWIPHLDCPQPHDMRTARNSAQAVAAIACSGGNSYADFSAAGGEWKPAGAVRDMLGRIELDMDRAAPTRLAEAWVRVQLWRSGSVIHDARHLAGDMPGWEMEHARRVVPARDHAALEPLFGGSLVDAYQWVRQRMQAEPHGFFAGGT